MSHSFVVKTRTYVILLIVIGGVTVGAVFANHDTTNPFEGFVRIDSGVSAPEDAYLVITRSNEYFAINTDSQNPVLELRDADPEVDGGFPYINFVNDGNPGWDARLVLSNDDLFTLDGADLRLAKLNPRIIPNGDLCIGKCP